MKCIKCGCDMEENAKFCQHCGNAVEQAPVANEPKTTVFKAEPVSVESPKTEIFAMNKKSEPDPNQVEEVVEETAAAEVPEAVIEAEPEVADATVAEESAAPISEEPATVVEEEPVMVEESEVTVVGESAMAEEPMATVAEEPTAEEEPVVMTEAELAEPEAAFEETMSIAQTESIIGGSDSEKTICPVCGKMLDAGAVFCDGCGKGICNTADIKESNREICPVCGKILEKGVPFCDNCGKSMVAEEEKKPESVMCPACGAPVMGGKAFCGKCGCKLGEVIAPQPIPPKTICPKCGKQLKDGAVFCGSCGTSLKAGAPQPNVVPPSNPQPAVQQGDKKSGIGGLIGLIVALVVVLAVCAGVIFLVITKGDEININIPGITSTDTEKEGDEKSDSDKDKEDEKDKDSEKEDEDNGDDEFIGMTIATPAPSVTAPSAAEVMSISEFSFNYGVTGINTAPTYRNVTDAEYSYYYDVPTHFIMGQEKGFYYAPDQTAVIKFAAEANVYGNDVTAIMNQYIMNIGGQVTYSANGDDWFAMTVEANGIDYYIKCFVDHNIRTFEMRFPKEYVGTYGDYINHIEDNFKRTDV